MATALSPAVELFYSGDWQDITTYVYQRDRINISRGRSNEGTSVDPSSCDLTLDNRDGRFTIRNPSSPLYGLVGRNTLMRVRVPAGAGSGGLLGSGNLANYASTPNTGVLQITGDIELRADFRLDSDANTVSLISKGTFSSNANYELLIGFTSGVPHVTLRWYTGAASLFVDHDLSDITLHKRIAIRATLDVNNGAAGRDVKFYTSDTINGTWTQHGSTSTTAGTTSIGTNTDPLRAGNNGTNAFPGEIYAIRVLNGLAGTEVANPDFYNKAAGSFADTAGRTWSANGTAVWGNSVRFVGEVSSWPQRWDQSGSDIFTPISASGITRRLAKGTQPGTNGIDTFLASATQQSVFPCLTSVSQNGGARILTPGCAGAVHFGSGDMGPALPMGMLVGDTNPQASGAGVLPTTGYLKGGIGAGSGGTFNAAGFVFKASSIGTLTFYLTSYSSDSLIYYVQFEGSTQIVTVYKWYFITDTGVTTSAVATSSAQTWFTDGNTHSFLLTTVDAGASTTVTAYVDGVSIASGSDAAHSSTVGMSDFYLSYQKVTVTDASDVGLSYITAWSDWYGGQTMPDPQDWADPATGYVGEVAGTRIARLCDSANVELAPVGDLTDTIAMGRQGTGDLVSTLREAAETDGGFLYEPRFMVGYAYRPRADLYNQTAALTLDYSLNQLGEPPEVTDDDQFTFNQVTASNAGGGSVTDTLTTGALSTQAPPNGINPSPGSVSVNVVSDALLADQAAWHLHLGTVDEARIPSLTVDMLNPHISSSAPQTLAVANLDVGQRVVLDNPPTWLPPNDVTLLALGYSEEIWQYGWKIGLNCVPESPYHVSTWATSSTSGSAHWDAESSTLNSGCTTTATSLSVAFASGTTRWTTDSDAFSFDIGIGGERITVTAISSTTSPQTFTVTRSVNGVVKAHSAGDAVALWDTPVFAL